MKKALRISLVVLFIAVIFSVFVPSMAEANHTWKNYHWARSSNPFTIKLGDNVSSRWDSYLQSAAYHWNRSSMMNVSVVQGGTSAKTCSASTSRVQVCSSAYGNTGWLGLAQVWANGDHITKATVKLNDSFFSTSKYNTTAWKNLVMCQEVGHAFGLGHQDENFSNNPLGSCMDYSSNPTPNQAPNMHDYYQLLYMYQHYDSRLAAEETETSLAVEDFMLAGESAYEDPSEWGELVSVGTHLAGESHIASYERHFSDGKTLNTRVIWAE